MKTFVFHTKNTKYEKNFGDVVFVFIVKNVIKTENFHFAQNPCGI